MQPEWALCWNVGAHSAAVWPAWSQSASAVAGPSVDDVKRAQVSTDANVSCHCAAGYDYTVLIAMSPVIQQAFFPKGDLAAKQLSFW